MTISTKNNYLLIEDIDSFGDCSFTNLLDEFCWTVRALVGFFSGVSHLMSSNFARVPKLLVTMGARVAQVPSVPLLVSPQRVRGGVVLRAILTLVHPG